MTADAPLGTFEEHVLLAVLRCEPRAYGMAVRRELEACTGRSIAIGAVYSTIDRMEAKGWVESRRQPVDGRDRRLVTVTGAGSGALERSRVMRDALLDGLRPAPQF